MARSADAGVNVEAPRGPEIVLFRHPDEPVESLVAALAAEGARVELAPGWTDVSQRRMDAARCVLIAYGARGLDRDTEHAAHYASRQRAAGFLVVFAVAALPGAAEAVPGPLCRAPFFDLRGGLETPELARLANLALGRGVKFASNEMALPALLEGSKHFSFPELPWGLILTVVLTLVAIVWTLASE